MESSLLVEKAEEWCVPLANHPRAARTGAPRTPMSNRLDSYLKAAEGDLPTMPAIANQVVQAVDNPDSSIDDIRVLIDQDAAIAARILKISNSALYGFPSEIQSLSHAISLLGTMTVRNLVLAASMKETYKRFGLMEKRLWQHSSLTGPAAAMLAEYRGIMVDPEIAFTAGLMHHVLSRFCDGASYADRDRLTAAHLAHSAIWPHSC